MLPTTFPRLFNRRRLKGCHPRPTTLVQCIQTKIKTMQRDLSHHRVEGTQSLGTNPSGEKHRIVNHNEPTANEKNNSCRTSRVDWKNSTGSSKTSKHVVNSRKKLWPAAKRSSWTVKHETGCYNSS